MPAPSRMAAGAGLALTVAVLAGPAAAEVRQVRPLDADWRFTRGDPAGAQAPGFDDRRWRRVDAPHDWSIEGPFAPDEPTGAPGGFAPSGVGWYRKRLVLSPAEARRRVSVEFDGVMANSEVWLNGVSLGRRPYGYVSFAYDLTPHLKPGVNVLAVRADNSGQPASRWYTGAGLYRHVRLIETGPVHFERWSAFVSTPHVSAAQATVRVRLAVRDDGVRPRQVRVRVVLRAPDGAVAGQGLSAPVAVLPNGAAELTQDLTLPTPRLWALDRPQLYRAELEVVSGREVLDREVVNFGVREARFDPATGFWLNGRNLKIIGAALHHDAGALGAAVPLAAYEHRLRALRALGVNAIRTAHNPPDPVLLDLCDRMGFLVMDEMFDAWTLAKQPFDYHRHFRDWAERDLRETVRRDRNHPSVVIWSAGNEIRDTTQPDLARQILARLVAAFHDEDPTRPVTQALFRPNVSHDYENGLADLLDVVGQNYRVNELLAAHAQKPSRKIIGTEDDHSRPTWLAMRDSPPFSGEFIWAGVDYLGEARAWPQFGDNSGLLDRTDRPKPDALEHQSWWSRAPVVHIARRVAATPKGPTDPGWEPEPLRRPQTVFADWTPADLRPHAETVEVYSNCREVELSLNGRTLGVLARNADDAPRVWRVAFERGALAAACVSGERASETLRTAGAPARLRLNVEHPLGRGFEQPAYVRAEVVDAAGVPVPSARTPIRFQVSGPAVLRAVDNGDNYDPTPFSTPERRAYGGQALAIVQAGSGGGPAVLTARAEGLAPASVRLGAP